MRIVANLPDHGAIVEAVLDGFVAAAALIIQAGIVPTSPLDTDVEYREESAGSEEWLLPHQAAARGYCDCEDLCIWLAGGLRASGEDPEARCVLRQTGPTTIHCLVQRGDGSLDDPSLVLMARAYARRADADAYEVSGYALSGELIVRDHRSDDHRPKPGSSTGDPITQYMADHNLSNIVIDTGSKGPGDLYGTGGSKGLWNPGNGPDWAKGFGQTFAPNQASQAGLYSAANNAIKNRVGPTSDAWTRGLASAQAVGDQQSAPVSSRALSTPTPSTPPQQYYTRDPNGNLVMVDTTSGTWFDPSTGNYYNYNSVDPYTGEPIPLTRDPATGQYAPAQAQDPYGQYGYGYGDPYSQYGQQYGYGYGDPYSQYGYDQTYYGELPDAYQQGLGGNSYDEPAVTYEDIYGYDGLDDGGAL